MKITLTIFISFIFAISIYGIGSEFNNKAREHASKSSLTDVFDKQSILNMSREELNVAALIPENYSKLKEASKKHSERANSIIYTVWFIQLVLLFILAFVCNKLIAKINRNQN
jgi:Na+/H+ antiporter NhaC